MQAPRLARMPCQKTNPLQSRAFFSGPPAPILLAMQNGAALKNQTAPLPRWRERWLVVALLLALASALVPALLPSGSPLSRLHGSAFDPSTSTVTLRVRSQDERSIAPPADPQGSARTPQTPPWPGGAPALETARTAPSHPILFSPTVAAPPAKPRRAGIALPRAPPILT